MTDDIASSQANSGKGDSQRQHHDVSFTMVALSYRGFWTSGGRASQAGIELDAVAALDWVSQRYLSHNENARLVIWGQSIGAGVATFLASRSSRVRDKLAGLVLETPFTSVSDMLLAFYPQKWLPYRYLSPFLRSTWDSRMRLRELARSDEEGGSSSRPEVLILQAGKDEVVPPEHAPHLQQLCQEEGLSVERKIIPGALHVEVFAKPVGRRHIAEFIARVGYG